MFLPCSCDPKNVKKRKKIRFLDHVNIVKTACFFGGSCEHCKNWFCYFYFFTKIFSRRTSEQEIPKHQLLNIIVICFKRQKQRWKTKKNWINCGINSHLYAAAKALTTVFEKCYLFKLSVLKVLFVFALKSIKWQRIWKSHG